MTKLSVFTPTHDPRHLLEAFESLLRQDYKNWEWVILPNSAGGETRIPREIEKHPQVNVIPQTYVAHGDCKIGWLKNRACSYCEGDVFVELDHDDMLVSNVLGKIAKTYEETGAGFMYSDTAPFVTDGSDVLPWSYHGDWGWETYDFQTYGRTLTATRNFPITPRSLCEIFFAPDHVRCWSREAYLAVGGHDVEREVCDDHDLMIRCYLAGVKFEHIGGVGYLYRFHPDNTVKTKRKEIKEATSKLRNENLRKLITEWCRRENLDTLTIEGDQTDTLDSVPWSKSLQYGQIIVEHDYLPTRLDPDGIIWFFKQLYSLLVPGGYLSVTFPSATGAAAFAPHYKSYWSSHTFEYFTNKALASKLYDFSTAGTAVTGGGLPFPRFQYVRYDEYCRGQGSAQLGKITGEIDLCALKGQRQPGKIYI